MFYHKNKMDSIFWSGQNQWHCTKKKSHFGHTFHLRPKKVNWWLYESLCPFTDLFDIGHNMDTELDNFKTFPWKTVFGVRVKMHRFFKKKYGEVKKYSFNVPSSNIHFSRVFKWKYAIDLFYFTVIYFWVPGCVWVAGYISFVLSNSCIIDWVNEFIPD